MSDAKKLAFFLPNSFTALNLGCGFVSVMLSVQGRFYFAGMILLLGAIFDSVDGRVARMTGTQSSFGEQFDSISDVVSFGFAPAFLVYNCFFSDLGRVGIIIAFIYLLCGALRLARFNANIEEVSSNFFQGLPIPSGALTLVGLALLSTDFPAIISYKYITGPFVLIVSLLLISNVPFPSFKSSKWVAEHKKRVLALIFAAAISLFIYETIMILALLTLYIFGTLVWFFGTGGKIKDIFIWNHERG